MLMPMLSPIFADAFARCLQPPRDADAMLQDADAEAADA